MTRMCIAVPEQVGIALDETVEKQDLDDLFWVFNCKNVTAEKVWNSW